MNWVWLKYLGIAMAFIAVYSWVLNFRLQRPAAWPRMRIQWKSLSFSWLGKIPWQTFDRIDQQQFRRLQGVVALIGAMLGWILMGTGWHDPLTYFGLPVFALLGYASPHLIQQVLKKQRRRALGLELPDALELIANSLRAGLSLLQALEVVAQEAPRPIKEEFTEVVHDCRLGLSPEDALEKMLKRWPHPDLEFFVVAAGVSLHTGGNLAEVAGRIIETVRERFRLQGRIDSLTAQGKLSGWVVGLLPFVLLVGLTFLDPELMSAFFNHPLGLVMLAAGLVMELVGAFFIKKIVEIEV